MNFKFCGSCGYDMTVAPAAASGGAPAAAAGPASPQLRDASFEASAPQPSTGTGKLVLIRPDGTEGEQVQLDGTTTIGRDSHGPFAGDSYLSPQHAAFEFQGGGVVVKDLGSLNGVYMRIEHDTPTELLNGSIFRIGQEIMRFEAIPPAQPGPDGAEIMGSANPGFLGRICLIVGRESYGNCYPVPAHGLYLGRERGDVIFPDDGYVSGLHCQIHEDGGRVFLTDVGSSNGTFVRVNGETAVPNGSLLLMGQQLFRIEI